MSLIGARPYTCKHCGTEFWVAGEDTCWCCPCCDSTDVDYEEDDTPIFAFTVDELRSIVTSEDEEGDIFGYKDLTLADCVDLGRTVTIDWDETTAAAQAVLDEQEEAKSVDS